MMVMYICTSVYGFGLIGVWRILHSEFSKCDEEIYPKRLRFVSLKLVDTTFCELLEGYIYRKRGY